MKNKESKQVKSGRISKEEMKNHIQKKDQAVAEMEAKRVSLMIEEILVSEGYTIVPELNFSIYGIVPTVRLVKGNQIKNANGQNNSQEADKGDTAKE